MKILEQEPSVRTEKWYVLYTKSQHERLVEEQLLKRGVEAYTPKLTLKRKWSDRVKLIEEPLFKSYCFAKFSLQEDKIKILSQQGVAKIVNFDNKCVPVEDSVIDSLKIMIANDLQVDPYPYLKAGREIIVKQGPLKGLRGQILEKRGSNMSLVVSVKAIGASVRCIVDIATVGLG